ncbi:MAG TPA: hypothetical protein VFK41_04580 [Nocardioidaceae bacterium]|nr:hypothetical protein [Nocardioidaceae bacterium]
MSDVITRTQLQLLARLLEVDVSEVSHLERLGVQGLKELRTAISNRLFDGEAEMFGRVSKLAPLVPDVVVVKVAQAAVPALVSGRLAGALGLAHPDRAVGLLKRLRPGYLADAAPYVDPRAVAVLAPMFEAAPEALLPAAKEMLRRKDYATAAGFLEFSTPALVEAFSLEIDDIDALIEAVAFVDDDGALSNVIRHVPEHRIREIIGTSIDNEAGVVAALSVGSRIDEDLTRRISDLLFLEVAEEKLLEMLETAVRNGAAAELVRIAARSGERSQQRMKELAPRVSKKTLAALRAEARAQCRPDLVP